MTKVTSITRDDLPTDLADWLLEHQTNIANVILIAELKDETGTTIIKAANASNLDVAWATCALFAILSRHINVGT